MVKVIDCPLCNGGKLRIDISNGFEIVTTGRISELPCVCRCKNCNRNVKYKIVKREK